MKLYRFIALICIHLASLFILGHAVFPHCHSGGNDSCVILNHNHNHCDDDGCDESQHHDCKGEAGSCILTQIIPHSHTSTQDIVPDVWDLDTTLLMLSIPIELLRVDVPNTTIRNISYCDISHYTSYISPVTGMRAPPVV